MRVLVVEDDSALRNALCLGLREEGYIVDECSDGESAVYQASITDHDLIVLDVMLPQKNGISACREIRTQGSQARILMLSARDALADKVAGLDAGADDYLSKPFGFEELLARLRALLRRRVVAQVHLQIADLALEPDTHRVTRQGRSLMLSAKEFALLEVLMRHPNEVISRGRLVQAVWQDDSALDSNVVDVFISYLRNKVDKPFAVPLIHTVRGVGYVLRTPQP